MSLTVTQSKPNSHSKYWKYFTNAIEYIINHSENIVFLLWGNNAKEVKKQFINNKNINKHYFLESAIAVH